MRVIKFVLPALLAITATSFSWAQDGCQLWDEDIGPIILDGNDDGSVGPIQLPFPVPVYGNTYTQFWINNNGNVTFTGPLSAFTAFAFPNNQGIVIVAPFFADVDTRPAQSGKVHYKATSDYVVITWNNVGYYNLRTDRLNRFQLVITRSGYAGFSYAEMQWTTGDASGGTNGFGGSPARAGFDAGDGQNALVFWEGNTPESLQQLRCRTRWYNLRTGLPTEDRDPPETLITEGPDEGALVCREPVRFRWTGVDDATSPQDLYFRWRVDGGEWSEWSRDTSVELTGLSDGEHTFEVQARDLAERIDETPASRTFRFRNDPNPPQFSNIRAEDREDRVIIQWNTDEPSTSQVEYRQLGTTEWQRTPLSSNLVTEHSATITGVVGHRTYEYRLLGRDECGNEAVSEIYTITIRAPDLQVVVLQVPREIWNDTQFDISWQVTNAGTREASNWRDRVYFSRDDQIDGSDRVIGDFPFSGTLQPGQSVNRVQVISIPRAWISPEGTYYIIVLTDVMNQVREGDREDNNARVQSLSARLIPLPDLTVPSLQAPATAFFGQTIELRWQVRNNGPGGTTGTWLDRVILANDAAGQSVVAQISRPNESALDAGQGYTAVANLTLPRGLVGRYYLIAETDSSRSVLEEDETNNRSTAVPIDIAVPPLPDLQVLQVVVPPQSYAGQQIRVRWRVENRGSRDLPAGERSWYDALFLSTDTTLDNRDRQVGSRYASGNLQPGEGYTVADFVITIPRDLPPGNYYLLVLTDATNRVYEFVNEANNVGASSSTIEVLATPPNAIDLIVEEIQVSPTGQAGETISVRWRVTNDGADPAPAPWTDAVYLSSSPTFDRNQATRLAIYTYTSNLPAGESYEHTEVVRLPECLPAGQYYIFVLTDDTNRVVEHNPPADAEANNISEAAAITSQLFSPDLIITALSAPAQALSGSPITVSWRVENVGDRATRVSAWIDRVLLTRPDGSTVQSLGDFPRDGVLDRGAKYDRRVQVTLPPNLSGEFRIVVRTDANNQVVECNAETNNAASTPIQLAYGTLPNLVPSEVSLSTNSVQVLQPVQVNWRVSNTGQASAAGWSDALYLARTPSLSNALLLQRLPARQPLAPGQSYQQSVTVTIPVVSPGDYYLLVVADDPNRVFEGDQENDNLAQVFPLQIGIPAVDMTVDAVDAPAEATAGLNAEIVWTVRNRGAEATYRLWSDAIVLSRDLILDPSDPVVALYRHDQPLGAGEARTVRFNIRVPPNLSGPYYVFIATDQYNELSETDETNNRGVDTQAMVITIAPPADLVVESVSAPPSGSPGTPMLIRWTVRNTGANAAVGVWYDSVYLSTDNRWDIDDTLIGRVERSTRLEPGESYTVQLNEPLPGVVPGNYYILVRADARNTVRETDDTNNDGIAGPATLDVIELQLGVPFNNVLTPGARNHFYKVNVPAGQTLLWTVDSQREDVETELYVRYGAMAQRSLYDARNERPFGADHEAVVPRSRAGYYFGLVHGADVPVNSPYQTKVEALPFGIRAVVPNLVGNAGFATLRILGAQFENVGQVFLVLADGTRLNAISIAEVSASEVRALFNLSAVPAGVYAVGLRSRTGEEALAPNALQVVEESFAVPPLVARISGPGAVRPGGLATYQITVYNGGRNDALAVLLFVRVPAGTEFVIPNVAPPSEEVQQLGMPAYHEPGDGWRYIPLILPLVPAGDAAGFSFLLPALARETTVQVIVLGSLSPGVYQPNGSYFMPSGCLSGVVSAILDCLSIAVPLGNCVFNFAKWTYSNMLNLWTLVSSRDAGAWDVFYFFWVLGPGALNLLSDCVGDSFPLFTWINCGISAVNAIRSCTQNSQTEQRTAIVTAVDPNEKRSPEGAGEQRFVPRREPIPYTVLFENLPDATAYARQVTITDQLDPDLDWRTFEVGTISFRNGKYTVQAPPGQRFFQTEIQMDENDGGLRVQILAGVDLATGVVNFRLTAIDPQTGEPPTSPLLGILPPNNAQREGEGFVTFRVRPKRNAATGTVITNSATIVFDEEQPITTNEVFNTVDALPPTTTMQPLPERTNRVSFALRWNGEDDAGGSGLRDYTVWVSVDGQPYEVWLRNTQQTQAVFDVPGGSRQYAFYVTATDHAGNATPAPAQPQAVIRATPGDTNGDHCVDDTDLLLLLFAFGTQGQNLPADFNEDGVIDDADLVVVLLNFGAGC